METYAVFVLFTIFFAAVTSLNVQTTVFDDTANTISTLEPFKKIGEHFYLIERNITRTWLGAAHFCRTKGAHLASFETEDDWKPFASHLKSQGYNEWFWIAGNDIDEPFKFFWISTGQPMIFTAWSDGQPDNLNGNEKCVQLWRQGDDYLMNDQVCSAKTQYICKVNDPKTVSITVW